MLVVDCTFLQKVSFVEEFPYFNFLVMMNSNFTVPKDFRGVKRSIDRDYLECVLMFNTTKDAPFKYDSHTCSNGNMSHLDENS